MLEKFQRMLDEYESELRGEIEREYEDELHECYGELKRLIDVEKLLHDIGLDPDAYYSAADRDIIRARIIGAAVPGVATL